MMTSCVGPVSQDRMSVKLEGLMCAITCADSLDPLIMMYPTAHRRIHQFSKQTSFSAELRSSRRSNFRNDSSRFSERMRQCPGKPTRWGS